MALLRSASRLTQIVMMTVFSGLFSVSAADASAATAVPELRATPELLRVRRNDVVFWPGQRLPIDIALQLPAAMAETPFVIDHVGFSCHCALVVTIPAQVNATAASIFTMSIHAPEKPMPYGGTATLAGLRNGQPATIVCVASGRVLDLIAWPDAEPLWDLGEHDAPISTDLILTRGPHPLVWDTLSVRVSGGAEVWRATVTPMTEAAAVEGAPADAAPTARCPRWRLNICAVPGALIGPLSGQLELGFAVGATPLDYHPTRTLRVRVPGAVSATPSALLFGSVVVGNQVEASAQLRPSATAAAAVSVRSVQCSDPDRVRASVIDGADGLELRLTFTAVAPLGPAFGRVELTLSDGRVLRVPYVAAVAAEKVGPPAAAADAAAATPAP